MGMHVRITDFKIKKKKIKRIKMVKKKKKRICLQCRRPGFDLWVGKIPGRRKRLPTPVFWPREFHGLYSQSVGSQEV